MAKTELKDILSKSISKDKWQKVSVRKRSGLLVPLFSVYSRNSLGIADFSDLKLLIDFCQASGNSILQLLPMNETGVVNCPYDSLSSFAQEPAYMSLAGLPNINEKSIQIKIESLKKLFSLSSTHLDYGIKEGKMQLLWQIYLSWDHRDSIELKKFKEQNSYWLTDFALYKALKEHHKGAPWYEWEEKFKTRQRAALELFEMEHQKEVEFHLWVQWQLYKQFKEAKRYAETKKVLIKGDLPILVSRDSADVWQHPEFFKLDFAAGAPPDMYCAKGQRWGMPTYNWDVIAADNFTYIKEKLKYAENFYDILRIDHVVGLFRIWSIAYNEPSENQGLHGSFDPADEGKWYEHGKSLLSVMINNTGMLLCAEDLGVIPKACTDTLKELGVPGNEVQRWVKDWKEKHDFLLPEQYRELSVAMLSTHDTTNWSAWWENEAGTVDEDLFIRKCNERGIDFVRVKHELFDADYSCHGRLRWKQAIDSADKLVAVLGKRQEEVGDFIDMYENTYREKEKLWILFDINGFMREKSDKQIVKKALQLSLEASSVFCINNIFDWLYLQDILTEDPYLYRINTPGTISEKNWSLLVPLPLEDLLKHPLTKDMREIISASARV